MGIFADMLKVYDACSPENLMRRTAAAFEAGLCPKCGKPTGAPEGYFKLSCDDCSKAQIRRLFTKQENEHG